MTETVIPGTYITVLSEGLISAPGVATGIVGVVGTAAAGPVETPVTLSNFRDAMDQFGGPDSFADPTDPGHPLTLNRALALLYGNGATDVVAVRIGASTLSTASLALLDGAGHTVLTLSARTPGSDGNNIRVQLGAADQDCPVSEVLTTDFSRLSYARVVASAQNRVRLRRGVSRQARQLTVRYQRVYENERVTPDANGRYRLAHTPVFDADVVNHVTVTTQSGQAVRSYGQGAILYGAGGAPATDEVRVALDTGELTFEASQVPSAQQVVTATYATASDPPASGEVLVSVWDGTLQFPADSTPDDAAGDTVEASYLVDRRDCVLVTATHGASTERYTTPDGRSLATALSSSRFLTGTADTTRGGTLPVGPSDAYLGSGSNAAGSDGAGATADDYARGLAQLENKLINIVVPAGQDSAALGSTLLSHLATTEQTDHERIGVLGAPGSGVDDFLGHTVDSDRVVLVAPGMLADDGTPLSTGYTAAAVAGLIAGVSVQTSLTNKALNVAGLTVNANRGQQEQLVNRSVLTVVGENGFRIVRGLTTEGLGAPFSTIPTRRIVDYAKYGVRAAADPYIGRLNNDRVRAALRATLDGFLTRMVQAEALTGYELDVSATRTQEINGEVSVTMTIQPTFSIEFILVQMVLR